MRMSSTLLIAKDVSFELPHKTLFKGLSLSIARGDRIGLIGRNGEGKTTLLKVLAKVHEPSIGSVQTFGEMYYLPQLEFSLFQSAETVSKFLEVRHVSWPLM